MSLIIEFLILGAFAAALVFAFMILKARVSDNTAYKFAIALALVSAFLLFWINGAVGIIGSSNNDANMMYFGVLATCIIGSIVVRFRPKGMAMVMVVTAGVQVVIALVAIGGRLGSEDASWPRDILILTCFYTAMWVASAVMFHKAAHQESFYRPVGRGE